MFNQLLERSFLSNSLRDYLISLLILIIGIIIIRIFYKKVIKLLKKLARNTENDFDDFIVEKIQRNILPILYLVNLYISVTYLNISPEILALLNILLTIIISVLFIRIAISFMEYGINFLAVKEKGNSNLVKGLNALKPALKASIWGIGIILTLNNIGIKLTALVASLGLGGVAIALASRGLFEDLFAYFTILLDRPFEIADFITIQGVDDAFVVKSIGVKTSRLQSISGNETVISNKQLTESVINNFARKKYFLDSITLDFSYENSAVQLSKIKEMIKSVVKKHPNVKIDESVLTGYENFSFKYRLATKYITNDYYEYIEKKHKILIELKEALDNSSIKLAYPRQEQFIYAPEIPSLFINQATNSWGTGLTGKEE